MGFDPKPKAPSACWLDTEIVKVFERITRLTARVLDFDCAMLHVHASNLLLYKFVEHEGGAWQLTVGSSSTFVQHIESQRKGQVVADVKLHGVFVHDAVLDALDIKATIGVPLLGTSVSPLGALCIGAFTSKPWTRWELEVLQEIAQTLVFELDLMQARRLVEEQRLLLQTAVDGMADGVMVHDPTSQPLFVNRAMAELLGEGRTNRAARAPGEWAARYDIYLEDEVTQVPDSQLPMQRAMRGETVRAQEFFVRHASAPEGRHFLANAAPLQLVDGTLLGTVSVVQEITQRRNTERALARSEALFRAIVRNVPNSAFLVFDEHLRFVLVEGGELLRTFGLEPQQMIGKPLAEFASPSNQRKLENAYRAGLAGQEARVLIEREGGFTYEVLVSPVRIDDAMVERSGIAMATVRDITEQERHARKLQEQAERARDSSMRDGLTKLHNRRGFMEIGAQLLKSLQRRRFPAAVLFVDLNGMKLINDELGHEEGDRALVDTANLLRRTFRDADLLARLGGDEFVVLAPEADVEGAAKAVLRLQRAVAAFNGKDRRPYTLSLSIGVSSFDAEQPRPLEELMAEADARMYQQKRDRYAAARRA